MRLRHLSLLLVALGASACAANDDALDDDTASSTDELTERAGDVAWTRKLTPVSTTNVATDAFGNAYVVNSSRLAKYDAYGTLVWSRTVTSTQNNAFSVAVDPDGPLIVAFDGGDDPLDCGFPSGGRTFTITKLSRITGACQTSISIDDFPRDNYRFLDLEVDPEGNMYLARNYSNPAGGRDLIVRKYSPGFTAQWTRTYRDPQYPTRTSDKWFHDMAVSASGEVYLTGWFGGTVDFGGGPIAANTPPSSTTWSNDGEGTGYLVKLSTGGALQSVKTFGNAAVGYAVAVAPDGRVGLGGRFKGNVTFGALSRDNPTPSRDTFVASFDSSLNAAWLRRWYGTASQKVTGLAFDSSGYLMATGSFWTGGSDDIPADLNIGSWELTTTFLQGRKMFLARLSPNGSTIWAKTYLTAPPAEPSTSSGIWVEPNAITITPNNRRILVAGRWYGAHPDLGNPEDHSFLMRVYPF